MWILWQYVNAVVGDSCYSVAVICYCILIIQVNYPVSYTIGTNFLYILTWIRCWIKCRIYHHTVSVSYTSLKCINIVARLLLDVYLCACAVPLEIGSSSSLIFCHFIPFSNVVLYLIILLGWWVAAGGWHTANYNEGN